jgi:hypothetical protein
MNDQLIVDEESQHDAFVDVIRRNFDCCADLICLCEEYDAIVGVQLWPQAVEDYFVCQDCRHLNHIPKNAWKAPTRLEEQSGSAYLDQAICQHCKSDNLLPTDLCTREDVLVDFAGVKAFHLMCSECSNSDTSLVGFEFSALTEEGVKTIVLPPFDENDMTYFVEVCGWPLSTQNTASSWSYLPGIEIGILPVQFKSELLLLLQVDIDEELHELSDVSHANDFNSLMTIDMFRVMMNAIFDQFGGCNAIALKVSHLS